MRLHPAAVLLLAACGSSEDAPSAKGWTALQPMPIGIGELAVATDGSKVYVAGGFNTRRTFQIYDVASNRWQIGDNLLVGTDNAGAVFADRQLMVFGGEGTPYVQIFDTVTQVWSLAPSLPSPRFSSVVELVDNQVHLVGGWSFDRSNNVSLASHQVFDLGSMSYPSDELAPLAAARNHAFSGVIDGKIYVTGGRSPGHEGNDGQNVAATEVYDPEADAWSPLADLPTPRSGGASAVLGGKLYVLGGQLPGNLVHKTIERYDPSTAKWETLDDMPVYAAGHRAVAVGGDIYVVGGFTTSGDQRTPAGGIADVWRYTPPP